MPEAASELSVRRRFLVLAICCMSLFIVGLDNTIVNVALPSIQRDLHTSVSGLQWTIDAYTLVLASLLMLSGSTGDRLGRRRTFQTGLALFTLGSLLCSLSPSLSWLIAARMLQAVGGSMLNPVAMSIITNTFTDAKERARAIGVWGATVGVSMALGPVVGGLLVGSAGWQSIFWINIPVGIAAMLAGLVGYESRRTEPLIDLRFFRSVPFSGATVIAVCGFASLAGFLFLNTLYLQDALHFSALKAGVYTLPMAVMTVLFAPLSGRIVGSRGPRLPLVVAGVTMSLSGLMLTGLSLTTPLWQLMIAYVLFGVGFGMLNAPITNTAVSGMPRSQAGVAAAVASTSRQVGQSLGVAVIGSVVTSAVHGSTTFTEASHTGWWITVGCGLAVLLLGILTTGGWARGTAARNAARLIPEDVRTPISV